MKYVLAGCALALCVGSAAMASDQLARQLGVEPGAYTLSELVRIKAAQEEDNDLLQNWAMAPAATDVVVSTQSIGTTEPMNDQLADAIGVDPSGYTLSELVRIKAAQEEDNDLLQNWAMRRTNTDVVVSTQSIGGAGRMNEQLARAIRVDPSDYTPSELAREFFDKTD